MKKLILLFMLLVMGAATAFSQTTRITGTVIGKDDGEPLMGAGVFVKGTTKGVVTNANGNFTIDVPAGTKNLTFSYVGMKTIDVPVQSKMNVVLEADAAQIEQVVVTGITTTDKRMFTGAADKLTAEDVRLAGVPEIGRALEGRSAGVSVQNVSGTFGVAPKIRVRGATSIFGSSKPLWIVDGVPLEETVDISADELSSGDATTLISSAIAGLNADDIESFDILKDGSATSIYGARAMAGVIVITTKKGKQGRSSFNYSGEFTMRMVPRYNDYNIMNSQDQMGVMQEMEQKGWLNLAETTNAKNSGVYGKMYQLINTYNPVTGQFALANTPEAKAAYLRDAEYRNTDWFDALFSPTIMQTHSVSMSSGTEKASYYASLSALVDPGWSKMSKVNRYTANMNATYKLFKNVELNIISNGSFRKQKAPGTLSQDMDVVAGVVKRDFDINPFSYAMNASRTMDKDEYYTRNYTPFNILHELDNNYIDVKVTDVKFQGGLKWSFTPALVWNTIAAVRYQATSQEHNIKDESNQAQAYRAMGNSTIMGNNSYLYTDPDNPYALPITVLPYGGIYKRTDNSLTQYMLRSTLAFNKTFADKHIVNLMAGIDVQRVDRHETWFRGWGLQYSMGYVPLYAYQVFKKGSEDNAAYYGYDNSSQIVPHERTAAYFATASYSWKHKYNLNGTFRYEGSNALGRSRSARWLPTWNISGSWNVHEEKFFEHLRPVLSALTFKASYSLTGDRGDKTVTNSRAVIASNSPWRPYTSIQESGLYVSSLANYDLTYEKKHELNLGAEVGLFDNRVNVAFDWYKRNNYDLIGVVTTQGIGGEISKKGNVAEMKSNGVELSITSHNIKTKNFQWTTNFIYSHTHNEVTKLQTNKRLIDMVTGNGFAKEGYPVRSIFSIQYKGLNNEGLPTFVSDNNGTISTMGVYFQDRDTGKGELDYLTYSGNAEPTDVGSLGNEFKYKNFRLNVFITYSFGNVVRLDPVFGREYSDMTAMTKEFANRWVNPGDEKYTDIPVIASSRMLDKYGYDLNYAYSAYNYSTERIAKGDFIRMKEISLSYDFPKKIIESLNVNSLSLKLQATNLFLIYADKKLNGQDPEFIQSGGVANPIAKQFTFTVRVGL